VDYTDLEMTSIADRLSAALADRYRIERELGQGGMATVFLAHDVRHDRKVAIKVLKPELAAVLGADRFVVEIRTTASLQHPHILPLFDSGTADGFLFYVMPYIQGETIREKLNRETQFGVEEAVRIAREVADALDYAHRNGVIHRDIKPENILLHDGRPMVMDFGIALAVSAAAGGRMTETGLSLGTPHYMSPEQATADKQITARSDIYSLASVLYEMLTGEPPHMGTSAQQIIMKIIAEPVKPATELRKSVPPNVTAALAMALEKLPADRFESAKAFAEALANPRFVGTAARVNSTASVLGTRIVRAGRLVPWAVTGLALAAALYFATRGDRPGPERPMRFTISPLSTDLINEPQSVAISRDGNTVVYVALSAGIRRLYARTLADPEPRVITGTEGAVNSAISPDGKSVVFATADYRIKRVPIDGGTVETLTRSTVPNGMSWSARLGPVLGMPAMSPTYHGLNTLPARGDTGLKALTSPGAIPRMDHGPYVLDDDETILYSHFTRGPAQLGILALGDGTVDTIDVNAQQIVGFAGGVLAYLDIDENLMAVRLDLRRRRLIGQPMRVADLAGSIRDATMSPTGTLALRLEPSAYQVVFVDKRGSAELAHPDTVRFLVPKFSPDGRRVAAVADFRRSPSLWLFDPGTRTLAKLNAGRRPSDIGVEWSQDGRRVLMAAGRGEQFAWVPIDSRTPPVPLTHLTQGGIGAPASLSMSPDGQTLAIGMSFAPSTGFNIRVQPVTDSIPVPFIETEANEVSPRFSPNGRWIAYASDESGRFEVYATPFPGPGARVLISDNGGMEPVWSSDGRRLYYRNGRAMMAADVDASLAVSKREQLFSGDFLGSSVYAAQYDISPDGSRFVMARPVSGAGSQIVVWTGWLGELKARLNAQEP
jgi:serine/threonine protein kinase/WD40 repeat protein